MDIASIFGLILAVGVIIASIMLGEAPFTALLDVPSMLVVFGSAVAAAMICIPLHSMLKAPMIALKVLMNKNEDRIGLINQIVELAETARRD
ncbi:MAG: hypothetical protein ACR2N1_12735 [Rubripirellula sp.]|jgi:chemotaxis protein MotA